MPKQKRHQTLSRMADDAALATSNAQSVVDTLRGLWPEILEARNKAISKPIYDAYMALYKQNTRGKYPIMMALGFSGANEFWHSFLGLPESVKPADSPAVKVEVNYAYNVRHGSTWAEAAGDQPASIKRKKQRITSTKVRNYCEKNIATLLKPANLKNVKPEDVLAIYTCARNFATAFDVLATESGYTSEQKEQAA